MNLEWHCHAVSLIGLLSHNAIVYSNLRSLRQLNPIDNLSLLSSNFTSPLTENTLL
jgi:hypothetical protein